MDQATKERIRTLVCQFFADECDVDVPEIKEDTLVIEDLDGDSLMLLALLRKVCTEYAIGVELKTLGRHLMKRPANTVGEILELTYQLVEQGDAIVHVEL